MEIEAKMEDFVILPRKIKHDYLNGKLTRNELDVLIWIFLNTNPYNGYFTADYRALVREFQNRISYASMRKIISSLRKKQYIYFLDHKGRKGSFPIYPVNFLLTNGKIQTLEYLKNKFPITTSSQFETQQETKLKNNSKDQYHNFKERKEALIKQFSKNSQNPQITTPYNDTKTNNDNNNKNSFFKSFSLKGRTIKELESEGFKLEGSFLLDKAGNKYEPHFRGNKMRWFQGKWWVIQKNGEWLEFAGSEREIEWRKVGKGRNFQL